MADPIMIATASLAGIDAVLAGGLLAVYARSYRQVRAPFTLGLMLFAAAFLAQGLLAVYAYVTMMELFPHALAPYMLGITAIGAVALGLMLFAAAR